MVALAKRPKARRGTRGSELELLARVVKARRQARWTLRGVCPTDSTEFVGALDRLLDAGLAERVYERCGAWFLRLTPAGLAAHAAGAVVHDTEQTWADREPVVHSCGFLT